MLSTHRNAQLLTLLPASMQQTCVPHLENQYPSKYAHAGEFHAFIIYSYLHYRMYSSSNILTSDKGTDKTNYDLTISRNIPYFQC